MLLKNFLIKQFKQIVSVFKGRIYTWHATLIMGHAFHFLHPLGLSD